MIREEVRAVLMHTAVDGTLRRWPGLVLVGGEIGERRVRLSKREWGKWARWMMNVKRDLQSAVTTAPFSRLSAMSCDRMGSGSTRTAAARTGSLASVALGREGISGDRRG